MRLWLALLTLCALLVAPLATPAMAAAGPDHCAEMGGMAKSHGDKAAPKEKSCCVAAAAALPSAGDAPDPLPPVVSAKAGPVAQLTAQRADVEVPPPRS
ncbi:hypothetical protein GCM10022281_18170 [Sphingomonas rosea]|uniref:Uncharacterized protein n=1 Tax=Sphingomonas rosea TaxID=335605 RepID=A0ABP7U8W0_9SPHN